MIKLDFEHKQSAHCESGVTRNLLNYHGLNITEPLVFGIGAGLFFTYLPFLKMGNNPTFSFRVWPGQVFKRTAHELGIQYYFKTFKDQKESMDSLISALDKGYPVGVTTGVFFLPHFPKEYRTNFNGHNMVIFGYENNRFYVSDTVIEKRVEISYDDLMRVRFAQGAMAPKGRMYYPSDVPKEIDLRKPILAGIKKTANNITGVPFPYIGAKGIRKLSKHMRSWETKLGADTAAIYLTALLQLEEEFGTGGAGFRFLYGAFLSEAAEILNKPALKELSGEMGETANKWREFSYFGSKNCKKRAKPEESWDKLAEILLDIAGREEKIFRSLARIAAEKV